jgi:hypothetical protein
MFSLLYNANSTENECSICLTEIKNKKQPFICNHSFHSKCIDTWMEQKQSCPICRETKLNAPVVTCKKVNKKYKYELSGYAVVYKLDIQKYIRQWDKTKCKADIKNHEIKFKKPYGVVGYCSCGVIQSFGV